MVTYYCAVLARGDRNSDVQDLIAKKDSSSKEAAKQPAKRVRKERHCRRCSKTSYNLRTCTAEIIDLDNSNTSN